MSTKIKQYERFNIVFRIQHVLMFTTFLLLSFTGWALKYPEVGYSQSWVWMWGGPQMAGIIHRIAGVSMLLDFAWHVGYLIYLYSRGRLEFDTRTTVIPLPKDVFDTLQNMMFFAGLAKEPPKFGRFNYMHKFDYWAVFWGMGIIGSSGFILAFPVFCSTFFPGFTLEWIWPLMRVLHSDEALLAIVFIMFWHFYNEHLKFNRFPMSWVWLTGKITIEEMKHEHPLEYEKVFGKAGKHE